MFIKASRRLDLDYKFKVMCPYVTIETHIKYQGIKNIENMLYKKFKRYQWSRSRSRSWSQSW